MSNLTAFNLTFDRVKLPSVFFTSETPEHFTGINWKRDQPLNHQKVLIFVAGFKKGLD